MIKPSFEHVANHRHLISCVIERAIIDYKGLVKRGYVLRMEQIQKLPPNGRKVGGWHATNSDVEQLLQFFKAGVLEHLIHLAVLELDADAMIAALSGLTPATVRFVEPEPETEEPENLAAA